MIFQFWSFKKIDLTADDPFISLRPSGTGGENRKGRLILNIKIKFNILRHRLSTKNKNHSGPRSHVGAITTVENSSLLLQGMATTFQLDTGSRGRWTLQRLLTVDSRRLPQAWHHLRLSV